MGTVFDREYLAFNVELAVSVSTAWIAAMTRAEFTSATSVTPPFIEPITVDSADLSL
jgi:hypothetical protein